MNLSDCDFDEIVAGILCQTLCPLAGWKVGEGRAHGPRYPPESSLIKNRIHQIISISHLINLKPPQHKNSNTPHQALYYCRYNNETLPTHIFSTTTSHSFFL